MFIISVTIIYDLCDKTCISFSRKKYCPMLHDLTLVKLLVFQKEVEFNFSPDICNKISSLRINPTNTLHHDVLIIE